MFPAMPGFRLVVETGRQADFGHTGQSLRDWTVLLRLGSRLLELRLVHARHAPDDLEGDLRDPLPRLESHRRRGFELLRRMSRLGEPARERHGEAGRVRAGNQLLGARQAARLLRTCRPTDVEP